MKKKGKKAQGNITDGKHITIFVITLIVVVALALFLVFKPKFPTVGQAYRAAPGSDVAPGTSGDIVLYLDSALGYAQNGDNDVKIPIRLDTTQPNIVGMTFCLKYDPTKLTVNSFNLLGNVFALSLSV